MLFHEFSNPAGSGGYAYSPDAATWTTSSSQSYGLNISFSDTHLPSPFAGGNVLVQRRERPEIVFSRPANLSGPPAAAFSRSPMLLLNGVQAKCMGVPTCEALYGSCAHGAIGNCSQTISVTIATALAAATPYSFPQKLDDDTVAESLASFRFASIHSDGMVLQSGPATATVWGFAPAGVVIIVHFDGKDLAESLGEVGEIAKQVADAGAVAHTCHER